ncbi:MAG TPA: S41 family peptidase [Bacteroidales bacterium]|nr:S41 family peptidase [Bacteroidales bacterium]
MKKLFLIIAAVIISLSGCKPEPDPVVDEYTFEERARDGFYDLMKVMYLWYDKIPTVKISDYPGPREILEAIRYLPIDRFSRIEDYDDFIATYAGVFVGHGIRVGLDETDQVRVVSLYESSDLWPQGVRRGWILKKVNGIDIAPIFISGDGTAYNNLWGPSTAGYTNTLLFVKPDGAEVTFSSTKTELIVNTVIGDTVFDRSGRKIAYFCFGSFIDPSEGELNEAFASFKAKGATDLIIDLRYNLGGTVDIALQLASLVVDNSYTNKICIKLKYNSVVASEWNESYNFIETASPLGLDHVIFITTRSSASASELVINSLKPWIDVSIVGDTTLGKPAGMNAWGYPFPTNSVPEPDYKYVFLPITFEYVNSSDEGRFYDGIAPDVLANDDVTRDFGDTEELSLKAALAIIEGTKAASAVPYRRTRVFSEGTQLPENLILFSPKTFKK